MKKRKFIKHLISTAVGGSFLALASGSFESSKDSPKKNNFKSDIDDLDDDKRSLNTSKETDPSHGLKCSNCGFGKYDKNGVCDFCDAVSTKRLNEFNEKNYKTCPSCNGTGWRGQDVCTICYGKGKYLPF